jgi:hypothetical protein
VFINDPLQRPAETFERQLAEFKRGLDSLFWEDKDLPSHIPPPRPWYFKMMACQQAQPEDTGLAVLVMLNQLIENPGTRLGLRSQQKYNMDILRLGMIDVIVNPPDEDEPVDGIEAALLPDVASQFEAFRNLFHVF